MSDVDGWLGIKYGILGQQANSQETAAKARAHLEDTQASVLPGEAAARNALLGSQAFAAREAGKQIAPNAESERSLRSTQEMEGMLGDLPMKQAQTRGLDIENMNAPDWLLGAYHDDQTRQSLIPGMPGYAAGTSYVPVAGPDGTTTAAQVQTPGFAQGTDDVTRSGYGSAQGMPGPGQTITNGTWQAPTPAPTPNQDLRSLMQGKYTTKNFAGGTQKVPGKGSGMVDTVPAMLAPGEAVLNKGAAEHLGRDNISALNAIGHAKMQAQAGQPGARDAQMAPAGKGNARVGSEPAKSGSKPQAPQKAEARKAPQKPQDGRKPAPAPTAASKGAKPAHGAPAKPAPGKQPAAKGKPQELSKGTHEVRKGKSPASPKIDPGALQALAGMLGGGGGMPAAPGPAGPPPQGLRYGGMV